MRRTTFVAIGALAALVLAILGACEGNPLRLAVEAVVEPTASFSASQSAGDPPLIVEFTDESTGAITAWEWDFNGDGEPDSTEQNPTHVFAGIGKHDVTLRVQGATGSDALTTPDCIAVYGLAFQADPVQGDKDLLVTFTNDSLLPDDYTVTAWEWDFGDGSAPGDLSDVQAHTYTTYGYKDVRLTVTGLRDGSPDSGEIVKSQYIYVAPIATLTTEPQYDWEARETVTFRTEDLKGDPSTDYTRYWVFGDGATDDTNDYPVEHRYDLVGTYDVQCTVSRDGQSHTSTTQVTIDWMKPAQQTLSPANDGGTIYTTIQGIDVCTVDLNGIAPLDVVGTFSLERHVFVWMDGAYGASSYEIGYLDNWPSAVACGDIDGDGHNDIVAGCSKGELQWCENTLPATAWTYHYINAEIDVEDTTGLNGIYLIDMDNDLDLDVLCSKYYDDEVSWFENDINDSDPTYWTEHVVGSPANPRAVCAADLDNDGDADVVASSYYDGPTCWRNPDFGTQLTACVVDPTLTQATDVWPAHVDADGKVDILASDSEKGAAWYQFNGWDSPWTKFSVGEPGAVRNIFAADVEGDGDTDVLTGVPSTDHVIWWENDGGGGTAWLRHIVNEDTVFDYPTAVWAADVAAPDGVLEVLAAGHNQHEIARWQIRH